MFFRFSILCASLLFSISALAGEAHPHQGVLKKYSGKPSLPKISEQDELTLNSGKAVHKVVRKVAGGDRGVAIQDIAAPTKTVWRHITNMNRYSKIISSAKECEVYEKGNGHIKARFKVGKLGFYKEYFIDHKYVPSKNYMTWHLDYSKKSEIDDSVGFWVVEPHPTKENYTRLYYSVTFRLNGVPGFIKNMMQKKGLREATEWVKRESEK